MEEKQGNIAHQDFLTFPICAFSLGLEVRHT